MTPCVHSRPVAHRNDAGVHWWSSWTSELEQLLRKPSSIRDSLWLLRVPAHSCVYEGQKSTLLAEPQKLFCEAGFSQVGTRRLGWSWDLFLFTLESLVCVCVRMCARHHVRLFFCGFWKLSPSPHTCPTNTLLTKQILQPLALILITFPACLCIWLSFMKDWELQEEAQKPPSSSTATCLSPFPSVSRCSTSSPSPALPEPYFRSPVPPSPASSLCFPAASPSSLPTWDSSVFCPWDFLPDPLTLSIWETPLVLCHR